MAKLLSKKEQQRIVEAIREAEHQTSGEIRVHVESRCPGDPLERAKEVFVQLNMHQTAERNGVIIYLALKDRKLAIWGDKGINEKVPDNFWEDVKERMITRFKNGQFTDGLVEGIGMIGEKLRTYFPYQQGDVNELSDEVSLGE